MSRGSMAARLRVASAGSPTDGLAAAGAQAIARGFADYQRRFQEITDRAPRRFEQCDWAGTQRDARERLALYGTVVDGVLEELGRLLGERRRDTELWSRMRDHYSAKLGAVGAVELAETFFNSVTRRVFTTVGVNPAIEYVDFAFERVPIADGGPVYNTHERRTSTVDLVRSILSHYAHAVPYSDVDGAASRVAERLDAQWRAGLAPVPVDAVDMLRPVFYRRKGAYLIGRVRGGNRVMPVVLALVNGPEGIEVDAALFTEAEASIVFSFTRSYFHVAIDRPAGAIQFLRSVMPAKPVAELYTALGFNKHGKTEFFRDLCRHLARTDDAFVIAPGTPGMVMSVFTLPSYDVVFKVIRDHFPPPKRTTREDVRRRYRLVFQHDRAGRLVDAQEFEHLTFPRERFSDDLLRELLAEAADTVSVQGDEVVIRHLYTERRVRPLNLYVREAPPAAARRAVIDYGQAIKDLAATNVFPGDLLLKNFGVTRHGRVIFYDYDELCLLDECHFRAFPPPTHPEDELAAEPWFYVGPDDIFPEELQRFLELSGDCRSAFLAAHASLFDPAFWQEMQQRKAAGEIIDVFPYPAERRIRILRGG